MVLLRLEPPPPSDLAPRRVGRAHWPAKPNWQPASPKVARGKKDSQIAVEWSDRLSPAKTSHGAPKTTAQLGQYGDAQLSTAESEKRIGFLRVIHEGNPAAASRPVITPPSAPPASVVRAWWGAAPDEGIVRGCVDRPPSNVGLTSSADLFPAAASPQRAESASRTPYMMPRTAQASSSYVMPRTAQASSSSSSPPHLPSEHEPPPAPITSYPTAEPIRPIWSHSAAAGGAFDVAVALADAKQDGLPAAQLSRPATTIGGWSVASDSFYVGAASPPAEMPSPDGDASANAFPNFAARRKEWTRPPDGLGIAHLASKQMHTTRSSSSVASLAKVAVDSARLLTAKSRSASAAAIPLSASAARAIGSSSGVRIGPRPAFAVEYVPWNPLTNHATNPSSATTRSDTLPPMPETPWVELGITFPLAADEAMPLPEGVRRGLETGATAEDVQGLWGAGRARKGAKPASPASYSPARRLPATVPSPHPRLAEFGRGGSAPLTADPSKSPTRLATLELHVVGPKAVLPPTSPPPNQILESSLPSVSAPAQRRASVTPGGVHVGAPLRGLSPARKGSACSQGSAPAPSAASISHRGSIGSVEPINRHRRGSVGQALADPKAAAELQAAWVRGQLRDASKKRAAASLSMMADRARPTSWTGGKLGSRREARGLSESRVGMGSANDRRPFRSWN